jgi:hypothetical protein
MNRRFFLLPVLIGVAPSAIVGLLVLIAGFTVSTGQSEAFAGIAMIALFGYMVYIIPPSFVMKALGVDLLVSPSGSMTSVPESLLLWLVIIAFYLLVGLLANRIVGIRLRN